MSKQLTIFKDNQGKITINNYGKSLESQNVRMDAELKQWLTDIGNAVSGATGNPRFGASSVAREAIIFYRDFYQMRNKLRKYKKTVSALIDTLP
ncbi:MAG: hypothetical protein SWH54_01270 [Thermodesulfobacteriota bacterium]|nr:hypothetical protein [Thermodesulfobacteriota bacterium]